LPAAGAAATDAAGAMANPITTKAVEMTALSFFFSIESQSMSVHDAR
jgi:glucokinase